MSFLKEIQILYVLIWNLSLTSCWHIFNLVRLGNAQTTDI